MKDEIEKKPKEENIYLTSEDKKNIMPQPNQDHEPNGNATSPEIHLHIHPDNGTHPQTHQNNNHEYAIFPTIHVHIHHEPEIHPQIHQNISH